MISNASSRRSFLYNMEEPASAEEEANGGPLAVVESFYRFLVGLSQALEAVLHPALKATARLKIPTNKWTMLSTLP